MEAALWISEHLTLEIVGIVGGLLFNACATCISAYTTHKDERARSISNAIAINGQYWEIWKQVYAYPALLRVIQPNVDLATKPVLIMEEIFVNSLILHLGVAYRAKKAGELVNLEGLQKDVKAFLSTPVPKAIWERVKPFQGTDFVKFVEGCLSSR